MRALIVGISFILLASAAMAQTASTSDGAQFVGVGDRADTFQSALERDPCDVISHNVKFCTEGSDWTQERAPLPGKEALYQLSAERRAAFTILPLQQDASSALSNADVRALLNEHVFENGPRGAFTSEAVYREKVAHIGGQLLRQTAIVQNNDGDRQLLTVSISCLDDGLGFIQSTLILSRNATVNDITEAELAFHTEVLNRSRISTNISRF